MTRVVEIRQSSMGITSWLWCGCNPAAPAASMANSVLVRQRIPSSAPGSASTSTSTSRPARRLSCSTTTAALSSRWYVSSQCCQSHPPHLPGPANRQGGTTRCSEGSSTSTASPSRNRSLGAPAVIRTLTVSPGRACRTNTTRPACRVTPCPPTKPVDRRPRHGSGKGAGRSLSAPDRTHCRALETLFGALGGTQLPGNAGHHHTRAEMQTALEPQGALVVQQLFVPAAHDVLGDIDHDDVTRAAPSYGLDVVDNRSGDLAVGRVQGLQRHGDVPSIPLVLQRLGLLGIHVHRDGFEQ